MCQSKHTKPSEITELVVSLIFKSFLCVYIIFDEDVSNRTFLDKDSTDTQMTSYNTNSL